MIKFDLLNNKAYLECFYCGRDNGLRAYIYHFTGFFRMKYYKFSEENTGKTRICCETCKHGDIRIRNCIFKYL